MSKLLDAITAHLTAEEKLIFSELCNLEATTASEKARELIVDYIKAQQLDYQRKTKIFSGVEN